MKLALYKAARGTILDKTIDVGTGLKGYSHCEIVFDGLAEPDKEGRYLTFSSSGRDGGCRFNRININSGSWYVVDLSDWSVEEERQVHDQAKVYEGTKYDYYGIFFTYVFFWWQKQKEKQWYCSEICAMLLGHHDFRIHPNELAKIYNAPKQEWSFKIVLKHDY